MKIESLREVNAKLRGWERLKCRRASGRKIFKSGEVFLLSLLMRSVRSFSLLLIT